MDDLDALSGGGGGIAIEAGLVDGVVSGQGGLLGELDFAIAADFGGGEFSGSGSGGLGVGVQGEQGPGGGEGIEAVCSGGGGQVLEHGWRHTGEARGEVAGEDVEQLGIVHDRVVVDLVAEIALLAGPGDVGDDALGIGVALHQAVGGGEPGGRGIGGPGLGIAMGELLLHVGERVLRLDSLAREEVDGVGAPASVGERGRGSGGVAREPFIESGKQGGRNFLAAVFGFEQELGGVDRGELGGLGGGGPESEAAGIVLTAFQDGNRGLRRWGGKQKGGEALADQLLGATVRVGVEPGDEGFTPDQRDCGNGRVHGALFGIHVASEGDGGLGAFEAAERELGAVGDGGADADAFLNAGFRGAAAGDEFDGGGAEQRVGFEAEFGGGFALVGHLKIHGGGSGGGEAGADLRFDADGTFAARGVVEDADADGEFVAGRDHGGHVGREDEAALHLGGALGGADALGGDGDGNDAELAVEIIGDGVVELASGGTDIDDAGPIRYGRFVFFGEGIEMA